MLARLRVVTVQHYFPTSIYQAPLVKRGGARVIARMAKQCAQIAVDDSAGLAWSARHYPNGFTSYGSQHRLHEIVPAFAEFERCVRPHLNRFVRSLEADTKGRKLAMTDCWVNIMGRHCVHGLHLHPHSVVSGTYYVHAARGAAGIKFEDPRLDRYMAALPRKAHCRPANRWWVTLPATVGTVVLFESWLRHEVAANESATDRVSISFNYGWF
jgi:uncharacterized protein (TIGR02466 family)